MWSQNAIAVCSAVAAVPVGSWVRSVWWSELRGRGEQLDRSLWATKAVTPLSEDQQHRLVRSCHPFG
jgi:hypothetical protein